MTGLTQTIRSALAMDSKPKDEPTVSGTEASGGDMLPTRSLTPLVAQFLTTGGDERITINTRNGRNRYGIMPHVAANELWFSSSTATGLSVLGQRAIRDALQRLMTSGSDEATGELAGEIRERLTSYYGAQGTETVLAGSGTEAELLALAIGRSTMPGAITNIVVAPDETGRGVLTAAGGCNFLASTSLGGEVAAGQRLEGLEDADIETVSIAIRDGNGDPRPAHLVDADAAVAVERALTAGRNVILHVLDCSKTGLEGVSRQTARALSMVAPGRIMVVVDACQLRVGEELLRSDQENGFLVMITGSKLAAGPPFSGALLVPATIAQRLRENGAPPPRGLANFSAKTDWPDGLSAWSAPSLTAHANVGLLMRWTAALSELERYHAIEPVTRAAITDAFARLAQEKVVAHLGAGALYPADAAGLPRIVCVTVGRGPDALERGRRIHERLRTNEAQDEANGTPSILERICHVGQPVQLGDRVVLRLTIGAQVATRVARRIREGSTLEAALLITSQDLDVVLGKWALIARQEGDTSIPAHAALTSGGSASLDPVDWQDFRASGMRALDMMISHLSSLRDQPVWQPAPEGVRTQFESPLPRSAQPLADTLAIFDRSIKPYATGNTHPMFMGWVHGGGTPDGMLAEMLAAGLNANCGGRNHIGIDIERQIVKWAAEMLDFPLTSSGVLVTGTSMANFLAVLAARDKALGHRVRQTGLGGADARLVAYTSAEAHGCIAQALELGGIGSDNLRCVETDETGRMDTAQLAEVITADRSAGLMPFLVVGTAGTVNTGAIDPLAELAVLARQEQLWFHVDGAFGAMAALSPALKPHLAGISDADSVAFDFHKLGQVPYDAGLLLVRDAKHHRDTFAAPASYLARLPRGLAAGETWPCDLGPDLSRSFRALKIWLTFSVHGADRIGNAVAHCCEVAQRIAALSSDSDALELRAPVALNIVCLGLTHPDSDTLVPEIVMDLQERGIAAPSVTTIAGRPVIRAAIVNHRTTLDDADRLVAAIEESLARLTRQQGAA
ncbi:MAG: pyridoxal phosphate-dependent decarboxylase family protein [Hyphomicrobiaceae bacterium]